MSMSHTFEQLHIAFYLVVVLRLRFTEFEIYHHGFVLIFHHSVWAMLYHVPVLVCADDGTLIENFPSVRESVAYLV